MAIPDGWPHPHLPGAARPVVAQTKRLTLFKLIAVGSSVLLYTASVHHCTNLGQGTDGEGA